MSQPFPAVAPEARACRPGAPKLHCARGPPLKGAETLLCMNQPEGFDCPGCAWPDPKHTSSFEFCENGGKAGAWEATAKRCTPEFFAAHTVGELSGWATTSWKWSAG